MKLKKIASLALAGVMAVSMLAGCATTKPGTDDGKTEVKASYSEEVGKLVKGDNAKFPSYVKFADSTELDSDLKYAVEYAGVTEVLHKYVKQDTLVEIQSTEPLREALGTVVKPDVATTEIGSKEKLEEAEKAAQTSTTMDDAVAVKMFAVSSAIGDNAVKQMIADEIEKIGVEKYLYSLSSQNGGSFNYNYTVSVSVCTKTVNSAMDGDVNVGINTKPAPTVQGTIGVGAENPSVTFVAVQVVRTATHQ